MSRTLPLTPAAKARLERHREFANRDWSMMAGNPIADAILADAGVRGFSPLPEPAQEPGNEYPPEAEGPVSSPMERVVVAPAGLTPVGLMMLAHEAGHVATTLGVLDLDPSVPKTDVEFMATQWGMEAIRRHGGKVTPNMEAAAREALMSYAQADAMDAFFANMVGKPWHAISPQTKDFLDGANI